jgi:hypothetical protein
MSDTYVSLMAKPSREASIPGRTLFCTVEIRPGSLRARFTEL